MGRSPIGKGSDGAEFDGLGQAGHRISGGEKLMCDVAVKSGIGDGFSNRWVVNFLGLVDLVAARIASGVVMAEILVVVLDGANDVSFHDLHVVDVVEQFEMVACDLFAQFDAPG